MIKVLVTGAGGGVGQGIIKSLKLIKDLELKVIAADMSPMASGLYSGDIAKIVPACSATNYWQVIEDILLSEKVDYYIPGTDVELVYCSENKKRIFESFGTKIIISNTEAISIADDKFKTASFLKSNNLSYPMTFWADQFQQDDLSLPVIVKPAIGCRSIGVSVARSFSEIEERVKHENDLVVQELVGDDDSEYTCTIVCASGRYSEVLILKRVLRAGDTYRAEPVESASIAGYVLNTAKSLKIDGSCNFQLRVGKDGVPKIFEINCRFSGTTPFCSQLGFNPVEFYLKNDMGLSYHYKINYNAIVLRYWAEVLVEKDQVADFRDSRGGNPRPNKVVDLFS